MKKIHHLIAFCVLGFASVQAQMRMESLTVADGLSQGFVTSFLQDNQGFIWMGTYDGLNRYDGYTVRHFKPKPFDSLCIQASYITALYQDFNHLIWVGTSEGLFIFDPIKERFFYFKGPNSPLPAYFIKTITGDRDNNIFVQSVQENDPFGLFRLTIPGNFSQLINENKNPISCVTAQRIGTGFALNEKTKLLECIGDTMILVKDGANQIFRYSYQHAQLQPFDLKRLPGNTAIDHSILWTQSFGYIFRWKLPDGTDSILPAERWVKAVRLKNGNIAAWFSPRGALLEILGSEPVQDELILPNPITNQMDYPRNNYSVLIPIQPTVSIWNGNILGDNNGLIWLSTGGWGVKRLNPQQNFFGKYLEGKSISSLRELPDGRIWVRLFSEKTLILNPENGQIEPTPWDAAFGPATVYYETYATRENNIWVVMPKRPTSVNNSLGQYDPKTGLITKFPERLPFLDNVPEKIMEDQGGNVWTGAHQGQLYRCRSGKESLEHFSYVSLMPKEKLGILRTSAMAQDSHGILWIGTSQGLIRVDDANSTSPRFSLFQHNPKDRHSISMDWVTCICPDPNDKDVLWIGTRGGGLNRFQTASQTFSFWTEAPAGLPDNVVYGILPDDFGNLWCSTNRGICRFTPALNTFITYQENDGLCSTEFNTGSYLRTRDGRLWFGGVNGLSYFRPKEIRLQNTPPPVAITGIQVSGVLRFPDRAGFLSLPYSENSVLFEFAALDFANTATNHFRHRLQGIDRDWVYDGTAHSANYAALPPGKYVLEVQGATSDSPWSDKAVTFRLEIRPPWYRHWLAYCLYLLLSVAALFGYIRYSEQVIQLRNKAKFNQRESDRLKEFEALKNQLFANIAHELRTPLTVILGLADRIHKGVGKADNAIQIMRQGDQLLHLTNQMLDLAKLENNQLQLKMQAGNIPDFIQQHTAALQPLANSKGIHISTEISPPELWIDSDYSKLQKILNNLIFNAIRHTPPGGTIQVTTKMEGNWFYIGVSDNGEGISTEDLPRVFDRFFQGRRPNTEVGASGIGLTLTRDLVHLMGGQISVESIQGEGSVFSILLPIKEAKVPQGQAIKPVYRPATPVEVIENAPLIKKDKMPLLLVIEDNPDVLAYLQLCLQLHFRLAMATNGEMGIQKALELIPDLILADVAMPIKNGYEVTATLKADIRTSHIPITLLTAKVEDQDRREGHSRGANAYLTKPFDESELLMVLHNLLHLQQQWKNRYEHYLRSGKKMIGTDHAPEDLQAEDSFMQKVAELFEANYTDDSFNLDRLCQLLNMSSSQLDRKMKALSNQSPMQMLRTFRLQKAQALLRKGAQISIKEVCFLTGFKNPSHFSRLYSKEFGVPPSET